MSSGISNASSTATVVERRKKFDPRLPRRPSDWRWFAVLCCFLFPLTGKWTCQKSVTKTPQCCFQVWLPLVSLVKLKSSVKMVFSTKHTSSINERWLCVSPVSFVVLRLFLDSSMVSILGHDRMVSGSGTDSLARCLTLSPVCHYQISWSCSLIQKWSLLPAHRYPLNAFFSWFLNQLCSSPTFRTHFTLLTMYTSLSQILAFLFIFRWSIQGSDLHLCWKLFNEYFE